MSFPLRRGEPVSYSSDMKGFRWPRSILTGLAIALLTLAAWPLPAISNTEPGAPPFWMIEGLLAAVEDEAARDGIARVRSISWLVSGLDSAAPSQASAVTDALFGRLESNNEPDPIVRRAAAAALGHAPEPLWTDALVSKLLGGLDPQREGDSEVRRVAFDALWRGPDSVWTEELVSDIFSRPKLLPGWVPTSVWQSAVVALRRAPDGLWTDEMFGELLSLLNLQNSDHFVSRAAADTLEQAPARFWTDAVVSELLSRLDPQNEPEPYVRRAAADALGRAPEAVWAMGADTFVSRLLDRLDTHSEPDSFVRGAAINALGRAPELVWTMSEDALVSGFLGRLDPMSEPEPYVRSRAAEALGQTPEPIWIMRIDELVKGLLDGRDRQSEPEPFVRVSAIKALGRAPKSVWTDALFSELLGHLDPHREDDGEVYETALEVLGRSPNELWAEEVMIDLFDRQSEVVWFVRGAAVEALGRVPAPVWTDALVSVLLGRLDPQHEPVPSVRSSAAEALGRAPEPVWTDDLVSGLLGRLEPRHESDPTVRRFAAEALGHAPDRLWTEVLVNGLLGRLDPQSEPAQWARRFAAEALGHAPDRLWTEVLVNGLLGRIDPQSEPSEWVRDAAAEALRRAPAGAATQAVTAGFMTAVGNGETPPLRILRYAPPASAMDMLPLLERLKIDDHIRTAQHRALAHIVSGGREDSATLLRWLGRPSHRPPIRLVEHKPDEAYAVLHLFHGLREDFKFHGTLLTQAHKVTGEIAEAACRRAQHKSRSLIDLAGAVRKWLARLPKEGPVQPCWTKQQSEVVKDIAAWIEQTNPTGAIVIKQQLSADAAAPIWRISTWTVAGWVTFWAMFLIAFPRSRMVQAAFLFNPKVRGYFSLGVVPLLLLVVPPLRRRLLAPFRGDLLSQARLDDFPALGYFGRGQARCGNGPARPVQEMLTDVDDNVLLRGEAGLGKTSALRWLASRTRGPVAFLHARDCHDGVAEAIARLMKGVQDTDFVRGLVHAGALGVIVDGLNEVSAATRERIRAFAASNRKAPILIGTQPIEWSPPVGTLVIDLLPLVREDAEAFLLSRPVGADERQPVHGPAYQQAVRAFLSRAFDEAPSELEREAAALVLSNPFDLAFAADLIAQGAAPSATDLIDEAFRLADEGPGNESFRAKAGQPFPLVSFGRHAVAMREEDRNWLEAGEFEAERPCLLERKLLVRRAVRRAIDDTEDRERFRHDRVWDFFIAAAFKADQDLLDAHLHDPRFRGAYLRIAETWSAEDAKTVRDLLVVNAAHTNDNSTSNEFVRRLQARLAGARRTELVDPAADGT
jgi:HEAT repeat protein